MKDQRRQIRVANFNFFFVYYESIKRELKIRGIYECRCDERLQTKTKEFKRLTYTGLVLTPKDRDEVNRREVCECDG